MTLRNYSPTVFLLAFALLLIIAAGAVWSSSAAAASKKCGAINVKGTKYNVVVRKGKVSCSTAKSVLRKGASRSNCGMNNQAPCKSSGSWQCAYTFPGDYSKVKGPFFCFIAKGGKLKQIPFWEPRNFKKSIVLEDR